MQCFEVKIKFQGSAYTLSEAKLQEQFVCVIGLLHLSQISDQVSDQVKLRYQFKFWQLSIYEVFQVHKN